MPVTGLGNETMDPERPLNWPACGLVVFAVWGVLGNTLVCLSIIFEKRLRHATNYFLFSLAVADLMVSLVVLPLSIINELYHGLWPFNEKACVGFISADVFLCSVSIVHMTVISFDRYRGLSNPFGRRKRSRTVLTIKILGVWMITTGIACPITVLAVLDIANVYQNATCIIYSRAFQIYGSIVTFFIPFIFMAIAYVKTLRILQEQAASCQSQRNGGEGLRRTLRRKKDPQKKKYRIGTNKEGSFEVPSDERHVSISSRRLTPPDDPTQDARLLGEGASGSLQSVNAVDGAEQRNPMSVLKRNINRALFSKRSSAQMVASEQKATKVLGVVFFSFFVCWAPFFTTNVTLAFCGNYCIDRLPDALVSVFLWLGYLSSTINPVIYTTFNRTFRESFKALLKCQCRALLNRSPQQYQSTSTSSHQNSVYMRKASALPSELTSHGPQCV